MKKLFLGLFIIFCFGVINAQEVTVTGSFTVIDKEYDGTNDATINSNLLTLSGVTDGDDVSLTSIVLDFANNGPGNGISVSITSASLTGADAGSYTLNLTGAPTSSANISKAKLTLGGSFTAENKTYDATATATITPSGVSITSGIIGSEDVSLNSIIGTFSDKNVGNAKTVDLKNSTLTGSDAGNYVINVTPTASANITAKLITIDGTFTASSREYDCTDAVTIDDSGLSLDGVESGDVVTLTAVGKFANTAVENSKTVNLNSSTLTGADKDNYSINFTGAPTASANITKRTLTLGGTFVVDNKDYDGNNEFNITSNNVVISGVVCSEDVDVDYVATSASADNGAGKTISLTSSSLTGDDAGNYTLSFTDAPTTTATINKKTLTIGGDFTANNKTYNGNNVATFDEDNLTLVGVVPSEDVNLDDVEISFASALVANGINVSITSADIVGDDIANYTLSLSGSPTTTANITQKELTIGGSFTASDKEYNALTNASFASNSLTLVGKEGADVVTFDDVVIEFDTKVVGTDKTVSVTSATITGTNASNYSVTIVGAPTAEADITAKELTIGGTFTANSKTYNASTNATINTNSLTLLTKSGTDDVSLSNVVVEFAQSAIGENIDVNIASAGLSGADKDNYTLSIAGSHTATANITAKALTISGTFTAEDKVYNALSSATIDDDLLGLTGVESGDVVTLSAVGNFVDKNVEVDKVVNLLSSTIGGAASGNYTLSFTGAPTATATISQKEVTIGGSFTANNKTYNGNTVAGFNNNSLTLVGTEVADVVSLSPALNFVDKNVGTGKVVNLLSSTLSGTDAPNYSLSFADAPTTTANITTKELTISGTFSADSKTYDGNDNASVVAGHDLDLSGVVSPDDVELVIVAKFNNSSIGTNKTVNLLSSSLDGVDKDNYTLNASSPTAIADITAKTLTITGDFDVNNKVYDGNTSTTFSSNTLSLVGVESGDVVNLTSVATFNNKNVGTGKSVTLNNSSISGAASGNYTLSFSGAPTNTADISQKEISITGTFGVSDRAYNGNSAAMISSNGLSLTGVINPDIVDLELVANFDTKNVGSGKTVNLSSSYLSGADGGNYTITSSPTTTAEIFEKELTISGSFSASNKTYDQTTTASIVGGHTLALVGVEGTEDVDVVFVANFNNANVGNGKLVNLGSSYLTGADIANYTLNASPTTTANITAKEITIGGTFTANNKTYNANTNATINDNSLSLVGVEIGDEVTLSAVARFVDKNVGTGKSVNLLSSTIGGAQVDNYSLSFTGAPTTSADISKKDITIGGSFTAFNKVFDNTTNATINNNSLTLSGVEVSDASNVTLSPVLHFENKNIGTNKVVNILSSTITGSESTNYNLTFTSAPTTLANVTALELTIDGSFTAEDKIYDRTTTATIDDNSLTLDGVIGGHTVTLTNEVINFAQATVGNDIVVSITGASLDGADAGNYSLSLTGAPTDQANISAKELTITGAFEVDDKTYDGNTDASITTNELSLVGIINPDVVTLTAEADFDTKNIGTDKTVSLSNSVLAGADASNYSLSFTGAPTDEADISAKELTITGSFTASNKVYDGNTNASFGSNSLTLNGVVGVETVTLNTPTINFANANVANGITVNITAADLSGADHGNYTVSVVGSPQSSANITAKELTISGAFTADDKVYDGNTDASIIAGHTLGLTGIVLSDDVALDPVAKFVDEDVANDITVNLLSSSLTGIKSGNYTLNASSPTTTADITHKELTITGTFTASNKTYDGNTNATIVLNNLSLSGVVGLEDVTLNAVLNFVDAAVGTGKVVNLLSSTLNGADKDNYTLNTATANTTTADITARALTITGAFTAQNKTYDGNTLATINGGHTLGLDNISGTDDVTLVPVANFVNKNVGNGKAVNLLSSTLAGALASNYSINFTGAPTASANITAKELTIDGDFTADDKVYDKTSPADINENNLELVGIVNPDVVTLSASADFVSVNVANSISVTLNNSTLGGADANNYSLSFSGAPTTTADITPKSITIIGTFTAENKTYDGNTDATIASNSLSLNGVESGDVVTLSAVAKFDTPEIGSNKTVDLNSSSIGGASVGNYSLSIVGAPVTYANITAQEITLTGTFAVSNKVYDGNTDATVSSNNIVLNGVVGLDDVSLNTVALFDNKNVGTNKPVTILTSTLEGTDAGNYSLSFASAPSSTANITQKPLSIAGSFTAEDKDYDGTNVATIATNSLVLSGLVSGDVVSLIGLEVQFDQVEADNDIEVSITDATIVGADKDNYSLTLTGAPTTTADIFTKTLVITAENKSKTYGSSDPANTVTYSGFISGEDEDDLSGTLSFNRQIGETIGSYAITPLGLSSTNYNIQFLDGILSITKKELTISGSFTAFNKNYDGNASATMNTNSLALQTIVGTDDVSLLNSSIVVEFNNATIGNGKTVSIISASLSGADAFNYTLSLVGAPTSTANITDGSSVPVVVNSIGSFINNGTFVAGTRKITFNSNAQQTIKTNASPFYDIEFNNSSNLSNAIVLVDNLIIQNNAQLVSGVISAGNNTVVFEDGATTNPGNANAFIDGKVQRSGTGEFTMPIGHINQLDLGQGAGLTEYKVWAPVKFTPQAEAIVSVRYKFSTENLPQWWYHDWTHQAPLRNTSGREYWLVESNVNLTDVELHWDGNDPCYVHGMCEHGTTTFHSEHLTVAYWDGIWKDAGGLLNPASNYVQGSIKSTVPFIPFGSKTQRFVTFGSKDPDLPLPVELVAFDAVCKDDAILVRWTSLTEINNDFYTLEKSYNGVDFEAIAQLQGQGNSNVPTQYSFIDYDMKEGNMYYRLRQTDFDGSENLYPTISVNCSQEPNIRIMPNPFKSIVNIIGLPTDCLVEVYGSKGERIESVKHHDSNVLEMNLEHLAPGIYFVRIVEKGGSSHSFKIIKN